MEGVIKLTTLTRFRVWSQPQVFSSSSSEPVRNQKPPERKTQRDMPHQSKVPGYPFSPVPAGHGKARSQPLSQQRGSEENRGHRPRAVRAPQPATQRMRLPLLAQGHPFAARARSPSAPSAPWCPELASPRPQGVACGAPTRGQRKEGGQRMRRLSPGEGREAGPYLIAEDAVRLVTPGPHGGAQLGLARGLQAERQQSKHSGRV